MAQSNNPSQCIVLAAVSLHLGINCVTNINTGILVTRSFFTD